MFRFGGANIFSLGLDENVGGYRSSAQSDAATVTQAGKVYVAGEYGSVYASQSLFQAMAADQQRQPGGRSQCDRLAGATDADACTVQKAARGPDGPWTTISDKCATDNDTPWTDPGPASPAWYRVTPYTLQGRRGQPSAPPKRDRPAPAAAGAVATRL